MKDSEYADAIYDKIMVQVGRITDTVIEQAALDLDKMADDLEVVYGTPIEADYAAVSLKAIRSCAVVVRSRKKGY